MYHIHCSMNSFILFNLFFLCFYYCGEPFVIIKYIELNNTCNDYNNSYSYSRTLNSWFSYFNIYFTTVSILYVFNVRKNDPIDKKYCLNLFINFSFTLFSYFNKYMLKHYTATLKNVISLSPTIHFDCLRSLTLCRYFCINTSMLSSVIKWLNKYGRKNFMFEG